jgi:hypothetical protein
VSLLDNVQGLLSRTYDMETGGVHPHHFVIGDRGLRRLYDGAQELRSVGASPGAGARTLVRETEHGLRASIYYPDRLIACLERHPPQRGLSDANVDAFATLVEELDHFLLIVTRARRERPLSLFELELHANVSKHLVLARFLAGNRGRLSPRRRAWLEAHLFGGVEYTDSDSAVRRRYQDAARWAVRFLHGLGRLPTRTRLRSLRDFHHANAAGKVELIRSLPAA